ncbi:LCP family protein [Tissierellaceae bacterium HCP3S3_D8]
MKRKFFVTFIISVLFFTFTYVKFGDALLLNIDSASTMDGYDDKKDTDENSQSDDKDTPLEPKNKDEILFLLLGVDTYDIKSSGNERTDTMMLTSVNFKTGEIKLLSIPRDTRVPVRGKLDKINHAHAYGGVDLTLKTVQDFLNIDVDHYVKVDYKAVEKIVDAIGGVNIDVPRRMKYDDRTKGKEFHVNLDKGPQTLNGEKAIQFLRWRKNNDGTGYPGGDVDRIKAQQMFMEEMVKQTLQPKNILKLPTFIDTYFDYVETNIPLSTILKGAKAAKKIDLENMVTATIPGEGEYINKISYYIYDENEMNDVVMDMFGDFMFKWSMR